jgi:hypothetical protein
VTVATRPEITETPQCRGQPSKDSDRAPRHDDEVVRLGDEHMKGPKTLCVGEAQ